MNFASTPAENQQSQLTEPQKISRLKVDELIPTVRIYSTSLTEPSSMMVDTGSDVNVVKVDYLTNKNNIDVNNKQLIAGITKEMVETMGTTYLNICDNSVQFQVVPPDFPIKQTGILGSGFLRAHQAAVDYRNERLICNNEIIPFENQRNRIEANHDDQARKGTEVEEETLRGNHSEFINRSLGENQNSDYYVSISSREQQKIIIDIITSPPNEPQSNIIPTDGNRAMKDPSVGQIEYNTTPPDGNESNYLNEFRQDGKIVEASILPTRGKCIDQNPEDKSSHSPFKSMVIKSHSDIHETNTQKEEDNFDRGKINNYSKAELPSLLDDSLENIEGLLEPLSPSKICSITPLQPENRSLEIRREKVLMIPRVTNPKIEGKYCQANQQSLPISHLFIKEDLPQKNLPPDKISSLNVSLLTENVPPDIRKT